MNSQLPHRFPFRFAQSAGGNVSVVVSAGAFWSRGQPVCESLLLEALAQGAALALAGNERLGTQVLAGVEAARFGRPVEPGMRLRIEATRIATVGPISKLDARAYLEGEEVARAVLLVSG